MHPKKRKILQRDYHAGEYSIYVKQAIDKMFGKEKQGSVKELITVFFQLKWNISNRRRTKSSFN